MTYTVTVARSAEKELQRISNPWAARISKAIDGLAGTPRPPGCKKLTGTANIWRIRIGDYRVIYVIDDKVRIVAIERISHRKEAYD